MMESPLGSKEFNSFSLFWDKLELEEATIWGSRAKDISDDHGIVLLLNLDLNAL